jgi:hypothetical protein
LTVLCHPFSGSVYLLDRNWIFGFQRVGGRLIWIDISPVGPPEIVRLSISAGSFVTGPAAGQITHHGLAPVRVYKSAGPDFVVNLPKMLEYFVPHLYNYK